MPRIVDAPPPFRGRPLQWARVLTKLSLLLVAISFGAGVSADVAAPGLMDAASNEAAPTGAGGSSGRHDHREPVVLAPGYADLAFEPPTPGSYRLPPLGSAADASVLGADGDRHSLHQLMGEKVVVLSFIYTRCGDVNGCPLATHVFGKVAAALVEAPELSGQVGLMSLSFDPDHDTPAVMKAYGRRHQRDELSWQFLTTAGRTELDPLLADYDQWVIRDHDAEGNPLGTMSHVLRVYLIDRTKRIRNIYSVSYLHADTVVSDIRTLLME